MKIIYRISDAGYKKEKPEYINRPTEFETKNNVRGENFKRADRTGRFFSQNEWKCGIQACSSTIYGSYSGSSDTQWGEERRDRPACSTSGKFENQSIYPAKTTAPG
jgi:hypothetical protein